VLRYLTGNNVGLHYYSGLSSQLTGYADASFADAGGNRRSTSGYVFMYQGAAVSWRAKLQPIVTLSSTEAESVALCSTAQDAVYLRRLFASIFAEQTMPTVIFDDNMSTLH
jgi:hypothetical protein